ncbi:DUF1592 domain-containing protein [Planctomicrobium piriforme]|uniref:Planctomycete cytochrome C n=1 Tax=Planctomicrobium piriforme TaxID=1576369 RepID=A0A1I3M7L0_9PLAN|nr:DUF1592 domain-containing protein [Planctomicrobium piriforme]SFI92948.1 Protein of unknown function [Planctomicrobium piriforme]
MSLKPLFLVACCCGVMSSLAFAQPGRDKDPLSWDRNIHGLLQRYCFRCHSSNSPKGDVDLAQDVDPRLILEHRSVWETAASLIESKEMPPEKAKQPSDEERALLVKFLNETLNSLDCAALQEPGPPTLRRLNRTEYDNSVLDLTGLDLKLGENFPPDPSGFGFDNIGDVLTLSPVQVEQYHTAARTIVRELIDSPQKNPAAYQLVLFEQPGEKRAERDVAKNVISRFATRAYRRPVEPATVDRLLVIYDKAREQQQSHDQAVGHMLTAVLISPHFLMRLERNQPEASDPYPVDDFELATRLSYFLWSRPPDDTLLKLAAERRLSDEKVLEEQTRRMLADPRSAALVDNFFGQWLGLRDVASHQPDKKLFPEFDESLRQAMQSEVNRLIAEIVQQGRPLTELVDSSYTYLNGPLSKLYGIDGVSGEQMQRVELKSRQRGGILTSAAVLMAQADPGRTNVPRRGNYVADRILGTPPPPPPPVIPPLEDAGKGSGKTLTLRELLEIHRRNPECASCHAKIDPLGFSLENYDAIGRWREQESGQPINASGELPGGRKFSGPVELKDILLEQKHAFARNLAKNMLIYALGRGLHAEDECVIRAAVSAAEQNEDKLSELIVSIVKSVPFRYRRNAEL